MLQQQVLYNMFYLYVMLYILYIMLYILYITLYILYIMLYILYITLYILYVTLYLLYIMLYILYIMLYILYIMLYILYYIIYSCLVCRCIPITNCELVLVLIHPVGSTPKVLPKDSWMVCRVVLPLHLLSAILFLNICN